MRALSIVKDLSIAFGMYRPARRLSRKLRRAQLRSQIGYIELFRHLLPQGALCFDIGAHIGEMSEALLEADARVISFEPNPMVLPELRARCEHYKNSAVVAAALGSAASIAKLYAKSASNFSSLSQNWGGDSIATYYVPVVTLDLAIQVFGMPTYCKIDVEGWELEVLRGLTTPIPLISYEFHFNDEDGVGKAVSCLERLVLYGASHVNLTVGESFEFWFDEWIPALAFLEQLKGNLLGTLSGYYYGNIFVKNQTAQDKL